MLNHFSLPTRVSRLYPAFSLLLAITSAILFYSWQSTLLELQNVSNVAARQKGLETQIETLTSERTLDKAKLSVQKQQITDATNTLAGLQTQLTEKAKNLTTAEQQLKAAQE